MLFGDGPKRNKFADAGVGENNIDSPLHLSDGLVKTIKVSQLANVALNSRNVGADRLHGRVEFLLAAARDEDIGTLFDEKSCSSQPNPLCPAGDDGGLAFELFGHCLSPLLLSWNSPAPMPHVTVEPLPGSSGLKTSADARRISPDIARAAANGPTRCPERAVRIEGEI